MKAATCLTDNVNSGGAIGWCEQLQREWVEGMCANSSLGWENMPPRIKLNDLPVNSRLRKFLEDQVLLAEMLSQSAKNENNNVAHGVQPVTSVHSGPVYMSPPSLFLRIRRIFFD